MNINWQGVALRKWCLDERIYLLTGALNGNFLHSHWPKLKRTDSQNLDDQIYASFHHKKYHWIISLYE